MLQQADFQELQGKEECGGELESFRGKPSRLGHRKGGVPEGLTPGSIFSLPPPPQHAGPHSTFARILAGTVNPPPSDQLCLAMSMA